MQSNLPVQKFAYKLAATIGVLIPLLLSSCGGGSGGDRSGLNTANTVIGGTITGLVNPLVLQNNGGDNLNLSADGSFTFATAIAAGKSYAVTILTQPYGQSCMVSNGTGTINAPGNITNVQVACTALDVNAPRVISTLPQSGGIAIARNSIITARFSEAMSPSTLTNTSFSISDGVSVSGIPGTVSMSADNHSVIFTPNPALSASTRYTATLNTSVKDATGSSLISPVSWSFTTSALLDSTAPTVTSTTPANTTIAVPTNSVVTATFSEPINPATLTSTTFTVGTLSGSVVASADNRSVTFTPGTTLGTNTTYTATLTTDIKDASGVALASNAIWSFTTGTTADSAQPILSTFTPAANSTLQQVSTTTVSATFNKPINCATVSSDSFQLLEAGVPVPGFSECISSTLQFKPHTGTIFPTNTTLNANLSASIKDLTGNAISAYSWSFGMAPWTRQLGTTAFDIANAITSDSNGNVYVAGYTFGALDGQTSAGGQDLFITKYNSNGSKQWTRQLGTTADDIANAITSDSNGNVYAAGYTRGVLDGSTSAGFNDLFIVKYDSSGAKLWTRQLGSAADDVATAITSDSNGNVYAAGYTWGTLDVPNNTGWANLFIVKYDSSGARVWTRQLGSAADVFAYAITSDSNGNVYAAGQTGGALDGQTSAGFADSFIVKYNSNGARLWTRQHGSGADDIARAITSDSNGNVYAAGGTGGALDGQTSAGQDLFITKYDSSGTRLWTRQLGTAADVYASAITSDSNGNVYAAGQTGGALDGQTYAGGWDLFITKYDSSGIKQWTRQLGSSAFDVAYAITSDSNGNVYAAGYTNQALDGQTSAGGTDSFIVKYDSSGRKR